MYVPYKIKPVESTEVHAYVVSVVQRASSLLSTTRSVYCSAVVHWPVCTVATSPVQNGFYS